MTIQNTFLITAALAATVTLGGCFGQTNYTANIEAKTIEVTSTEEPSQENSDALCEETNLGKAISFKTRTQTDTWYYYDIACKGTAR